MYSNTLAGFSLLEVLISLLLLSLVLFGFDATEVYGLRTMRAAYYFDIANQQLNNIVERLHVIDEDSDISQEVDIWNAQNKIVLPQGVGQVTGYFPFFTITMYWGNRTPPCHANQFGTSGCLIEHINIMDSRSLN